MPFQTKSAISILRLHEYVLIVLNKMVKIIHPHLIFTYFVFLSVFHCSGQESLSTETIKGYAPAYIGQEIKVAIIEDFLSYQDSVIAQTVVRPDSSFSISFHVTEPQKVLIFAGKNRSYLYVQPRASYTIFVPEKDKYEPFRPNGNQLEITFLELDSNDINYKILQFQHWLDEFVSSVYPLKSAKPIEFAQKMQSFKDAVNQKYQISDTIQTSADSPSQYFKVFVRYSIASLDDIQTATDRNRYEKHDFYLKFFPVCYHNDAYMQYVSNFYEKLIPRLSMEVSNRYYLGVLKNSPSLIMRALGQEYTLVNLRLRELIMIKSLAEAFYSNGYPQQNIIAVLDSVSKNSLFHANGPIAQNMLNRLTQVVPGTKAPNFYLLNDSKDTLTLLDFRGKYLYIQFVDPESARTKFEMDPLIKLHYSYKDYIQFITVLSTTDANMIQTEVFNSIPWQVFGVDVGNKFLINYHIATFPSYVLIDNQGYIVSIPALGPLPNGLYETIEKTFFYIKKMIENSEKEKH